MIRLKIVVVCGAALLIAAAVGVALHDRRQILPLPEMPVAVPAVEVRTKAVERKAELLKQGGVALVLGAVAIVCGMDEATADRYETRNDALRSIARQRDLSKNDVAALLAYLRSQDDKMRALQGRTLLYKLYCICLIPWGLCRVPRGEILEEKTEAYIGEVWYTIARNQMTYNTTGKRITSENLAGQVTTTAWDQFACTSVDELISAAKNAKSAKHACDFDDIGNRESSSERGTNSVYAANQLNRYCSITTLTSDVGLQTSSFPPQFDDDGNQTRIKTATGIWSVTYNGENRPILWENISTNSSTPNPSTHNSSTPNSSTPTLISMSYDRMGRRVTKNDQRFVYDGYLQIANFEHQTSNIKLQTFIWDPTEPVATRPLAWKRSELSTPHSALLFYTHDGNKNVSEVLTVGYSIVAHYEYAPFGAVAVQCGASSAANPWRFSSEYADDAIGLVYYNYRHYEPVTGRWLSEDPIEENGCVNLYVLCNNGPTDSIDVLGEISAGEVFGMIVSDLKCRLQGTGSLSYTIWPRPRLQLVILPPVWVELNVTVYAEITSCCDSGEFSSKIRIGAAVDAYVATGVSWKKEEPSHHDLKKKRLTRNSKATDPGTGKMSKYKNHHSEVHSGYRDRWGAFGLVGNTSMPECPETMTAGVDWSIFIRGSAGLGFGYQFNIAKHFTTFSDFSVDNLLTNISSTGSKAWGVTGFSLEVGLTADFYVEEKLHDFLRR